ncbi:MAG TPA: SusD/RagB family nutrient-binding outer membrane lipoprotein [Longimicrobiales bacterium]
MNHRPIARTALLAALVGSLSACSDLTGLNENPNAPTDVSAEFLLPQAIRAGVEQTFGATMMLSHTGIWAGHYAQIQYPDEEQGLLRPGTMDGFWDGYYAGPLKDIQTVVEKGQELSEPNHEGVGLIWRSWLFHQATDLWGDVPYTEALAGAANTTPVYDPQAAIYAGLLNDLEAGAAMLDPSAADFGDGDILYDNDMAKWERFANSLRMRLAMRLVNQDPALAGAEFQAAYTAGGFTSNADNAMLNWPGAPYENPLYENALGRDDHSISGALVDTLLSLSDPRLELYAEPAAADGAYRGHYNGYSDPPLTINNYSRIGSFWRHDGAATPTAIMTYAEVLFLQAEAVARGWPVPGNEAQLYYDAIRASMNQYDAWGPAGAPTDAEIAAYLLNPLVVYNPAAPLAARLDKIHLQLWIALYANANETFSHWRRTGTPDLTPGPDLVTAGGVIPIRFSYPSGEQSFNGANLDAAVARQGGGNDLVTPLWWMP